MTGAAVEARRRLLEQRVAALVEADDESTGWYCGLDEGGRQQVLEVLRTLGRVEVAEVLHAVYRERAEAQLAAERRAEVPESDPATDEAFGQLVKRPVAVGLLELANSRWRFFADEDGAVWATRRTGTPGRELPLRGKASFRSVLVSEWLASHGQPPAEGALRQALDVIEGAALLAPREARAVRAEDDTAPEDSFDDVAAEDGAGLLDEVEVLLRRFVSFPSEAAAVASVLWAAHTHAVEAFDSTPRLAPISPEPQCGKTRLLEVLELVCRRARHVMNSTVPFLFRVVELERPTILFDEVDTIFGPKADRANEDLRGLLNAGHRRGATVGRMVGEGAAMVPKEFDVFAPAALAGIGDLPATLMSRAVVLRMRRRAPGEVVEPFRRRDVEEHAGPLQRRLAAWGKRNVDALAEARPVMPPGVVDRPADCWEPLLAVADQAGGGWPARARKACAELVQAEQDSAQSLGIRLLAAIRTAFTGMSTSEMWSDDLCRHLNGVDDAGWAAWNDGAGIRPADLARRLKAFGVAPEQLRVGDKNRRGYKSESFVDVWDRYLAPGDDRKASPDFAATAATAATAQVAPVAGSGAEPLQPLQPGGGVAAVAACSGQPSEGCTAVTSDVAAVAAVAATNGHASRDAGYWASVDAGADDIDEDGE